MDLSKLKSIILSGAAAVVIFGCVAAPVAEEKNTAKMPLGLWQMPARQVSLYTNDFDTLGESVSSVAPSGSLQATIEWIDDYWGLNSYSTNWSYYYTDGTTQNFWRAIVRDRLDVQNEAWIGTNLYVGNSAWVTNDLTVGDDLIVGDRTTTSNLVVSGVTTTATLTVSSSATISTNLTVGRTTSTSNLVVSGVTTTATLTVTGSATISNLTVTGTLSASTGIPASSGNNTWSGTNTFNDVNIDGKFLIRSNDMAETYMGYPKLTLTTNMVGTTVNTGTGITANAFNLIFDADRDTGRSGTLESGSIHSYTVDLGANYSGFIVCKLGGTNMAAVSYSVALGTYQSNYSGNTMEGDIVEFESGNSGDTSLVNGLSPFAGRYIRVVCQSGSSGLGTYQLYDISVYGVTVEFRNMGGF